MAKILYEGKEYETSIIEGTAGEKAIDVRKLRADTGMITLDSGYANTGSCLSDITFIDGEKGILRYRGIPIEELAGKTSFVEGCYLVIHGHLPNQEELTKFKAGLKKHALLHESMHHFFTGFPSSAHPMAILSSMVCAMSAYYPNCGPEDHDTKHWDENILRLISSIRTLAAFAYKQSIGQPMVYPRHDLSFTGNFLNMMFDTPSYPYEIIPEVEDALDLLFLLHADHEQNCSASTVRLVGSAQTNLYAAVSAGISALWGPLHGGANQQVMIMLQQILEEGGNVKKVIEDAKDKSNPRRLMGFGHRVYKNFDPRAKVIKKACDKVLDRLGIKDPILEIAKELEEAALKDDYFVERKLYPNIDYYSGIIYKAIGIPTNAYTVCFAIGRMPGWISQFLEMRKDKACRIGRPRQIYMGTPLDSFKPMEER